MNTESMTIDMNMTLNHLAESVVNPLQAGSQLPVVVEALGATWETHRKVRVTQEQQTEEDGEWVTLPPYEWVGPVEEWAAAVAASTPHAAGCQIVQYGAKSRVRYGDESAVAEVDVTPWERRLPGSPQEWGEVARFRLRQDAEEWGEARAAAEVPPRPLTGSALLIARLNEALASAREAIANLDAGGLQTPCELRAREFAVTARDACAAAHAAAQDTGW